MFHVKQPSAEALEVYKSFIERYHQTLDLISPRALHHLDDMILEGLDYAGLVAPHLTASQPLLDIGSGVGFPAIPLALAFPEHRIYLVERRQRRAGFLKMVAGQLGLRNVTVVASDVQALSPADISFSVVTAQAVGTFHDVYCLSRHLHTPNVLIVSRKGDTWPAEVDALASRLGTSPLSVRHQATKRYGTLVAVELPGGLPCPSSG